MRGTQFGRPLRHILLTALILALAAMATFAATAGAGPAGPTLTLAELQAKLASGPLTGHMVTTMQGSTPETIPVDVLAVVEGATWGKLILFESSDTRIVGNGGIAAGMSGSPLYVNDSGTDKLVGAVSYGEEFSLAGTGLATPIEYMAQEQAKYGTAATTTASATDAGRAMSQTVKLASPVHTSAGVVRSLVLAANRETAGATTAAAGQIVMHPLGLAQIGGLPVKSNAYKKLAAKLENAGLTVVPATSSSSVGTTPALAAGSPCGVLFSNGLYWMGVLGTVTYVDGTTAMAFGHPVLGSAFGWGLGVGAMQGTLTGATVEGIWPSSAFPYKMMTPADAKGTATQDRSAGLMAIVGDASARSSEFPVTTTVTVNGAAGPVVDTTSVGQWLATSYWPGSSSEWGTQDPGAVGMLVSAGLYHALDSDATTGGGATTTTVVVHEPGGSPITIAHNNIWDTDGSDWPLGDLAAGDASGIIASLVNDPYGLRHVIVDSVNVTATLSGTRRYAGLVDVQLARALRVGDNDVAAKYYQYGSPVLQTQHVTLTIPAGTSLNGSLGVFSAEAAMEQGYGYSMSDSEPADAPETVAQIAAQLNSAGTNGDLVVTYTPKGSGSDDFDSEPTAAAETTAHTAWVFRGSIAKQTAGVKVRVPAKVSLGAPVVVTGLVMGATDDVPVALYVARVGKHVPATPTQTVTANYAQGVATFMAVLPPSSHSEVVTAEVAALTDDSLPGGASDTVEVRAVVSLSAEKAGAKVLLTATVHPKDCGGKVLFQRRVGGHWVKVAKVAVSRRGVARASLKAKTIPALRAKFIGNAKNAASGWALMPAGR